MRAARRPVRICGRIAQGVRRTGDPPSVLDFSASSAELFGIARLCFMRLSELFRARDFVLSIEIFPPKTAEGDAALEKHLRTLTAYNKAFVS